MSTSRSGSQEELSQTLARFKKATKSLTDLLETQPTETSRDDPGLTAALISEFSEARRALRSLEYLCTGTALAADKMIINDRDDPDGFYLITSTPKLANKLNSKDVRAASTEKEGFFRTEPRTATTNYTAVGKIAGEPCHIEFLEVATYHHFIGLTSRSVVDGEQSALSASATIPFVTSVSVQASAIEHSALQWSDQLSPCTYLDSPLF